MSCYEWERGEVRLPAKEFARFRREFLSWYNVRQKQLFQRAQDIYKELRACSNQPDFNLSDELEKKLTLVCSMGRYFGLGTHSSDIDGRVEIERSLLTPRWKEIPGKGFRERPPRLKKPKAKDFPTVLLSTTRLSLPDASIHFVPASYTLIWNVPENNHACDRAREHSVAQELFVRLDKVKWVRGTGGQLVGNDEYRRDCLDAGGGSNYVKQTWGPRGFELSRP